MHACIPEALARMIGIKTLTIGYTKDIELAENIARATGAQELLIETRPEGDTLMLDEEEQAEWRNRGWRLEGRTAKKILVANLVEGNPAEVNQDERKNKMRDVYTNRDDPDAGRLKANMLYERDSDGSDGMDDEESPRSNGDQTDDQGTGEAVHGK